MKILFISDIHANLPALEALTPHIISADQTICLGDILGYHCFVNEVIDFIQLHHIFCIQGNHDRYVIEGLSCQTKSINDSVRFGIEYAQNVITNDNLTWLKSLPVSTGFKEDNCSILCCHGSPWDPINGYIYADSDLFPKMSDFQYNYIALGHTHREYVHTINAASIFNPGSVGQARDHEGIACAKLLDIQNKEITSIFEPYDFQKTLSDSIKKGAKEWVYKHFSSVLNI